MGLSLGRGLRRAFRWSRERRPLPQWSRERLVAPMLAGLRASGRGLVRHRRALGPVTLRVAWWSALLLLVVGGQPVLGLDPLPEPEVVLAPFAAGLTLCAALQLGSSRRHLRFAALALGALHSTAITLVWTAFYG